MSFNIECPNCGHQIQTEVNVLDAINSIVGRGSFGRPEEKIGEWGLFFRAYISAAESTTLIGIAIAYRPGQSQVLGVVAGSSRVQELRSGDLFYIGQDLMVTDFELAMEKGAEPFVTAKESAMKLLREHILNLEVPA